MDVEESTNNKNMKTSQPMMFKTGRINLEIHTHGKKFLPILVSGHPCCKGKSINLASFGDHVTGMSYAKALKIIKAEANGLNGASKELKVMY